MRNTSSPAAFIVACATLLITFPASVNAQAAPAHTIAARVVTADRALDVHAAVADAGALRQDTARAPALRPLRVAKYSTAVLAAGAALYGLRENRRGDRLFDELEQTCEVEPDRCTVRADGGAYADAALEAQYQEVRSHDRRARGALLAGQVAVATSAVLFILDLRNMSPPRTIPYDPDRVSVGMAGDGGFRLGFRLPAPSR